LAGRRDSIDYLLDKALKPDVLGKSRVQEHETNDMSSGGYRPSSGRPCTDINALTSTEYMPKPGGNGECERKSPLAYLVDLYNDATIDPQRRDRAAIAALPFLHRHMTKMTKAEEQQDRLDGVCDDRFLPRAAPKTQVLGDVMPRNPSSHITLRSRSPTD